MKFSRWSYKKKVIVLIVLIGILRLTLGSIVELGNDESYYWLYSQHLKLNYFDHPGMIALWIRISTLNLWLQNYPGFIRLGSVISCCIASWFMFKCVSALCNERAGWLAAILYNAFFYSGITAGILAFPDAPQMVFWTWSMYLIVRITQNENSWKNWLLFGVISGLCIMSKIHGLYIWLGLGFYILFYRRGWLPNPKLYAALTISIVICLPILLWNIRYNFMTYKFNGPRIDIANSTINWSYFLNEVDSQSFNNNPVNFIFIIIGLIALWKRRLTRLPALTILNFVGILHAATLLFIALYKQTLAHWSGPAYVSLLPVAAIYLDSIKKKIATPIVSISIAMHIFVLLYCTLFINEYPGTSSSHGGRWLGLNDKSLDLYGWKEAGEKFDSIYVHDEQQKIIPPNTPIVFYKWSGAHTEYYFCRPIHIKMIGLNDVISLHEYAWMNNLRKDSVNMQQAFCIVPSDAFYKPANRLGAYYSNFDSVTTIHTFRRGLPAHNFEVYHLSGWKGSLPLEQ